MDKRKALTFHTLLRILVACSFFVNLNKNKLGPRIAKGEWSGKELGFCQGSIYRLVILNFLGDNSTNKWK
jgi:hypothetical protein